MAAITLLLETQNPNRDNETISRFVLCSIISEEYCVALLYLISPWF